MAVTVRGTDILFNDGTTQSTAAGAVTTTTVLNATAGASVGGVGTYGLFLQNAGSTMSTIGGTVAGSNLVYCAGPNNNYSPGAGTSTRPSGTWRMMGMNFYSEAYSTRVGACVYLRIS